MGNQRELRVFLLLSLIICQHTFVTGQKLIKKQTRTLLPKKFRNKQIETNQNQNHHKRSIKSIFKAKHHHKFRTKDPYTLLIASICIDILTYMLKFATFWEVGRKTNDIKIKIGESFGRFYQEQLKTKKNLCMRIRVINAAFNPILEMTSLKVIQIKLTLREYITMLKDVKDIESLILRQIVVGEYYQTLDSLDSMFETAQKFVSGFENAVCLNSINLAGENTVIKSMMSVLNPQQSFQASGWVDIIKGSLMDFLIFYFQANMLSTMDFVNTSNNLPDGIVNVSDLSNISDEQYNTLQSGALDATSQQFEGGKGLYKVDKGIVYIVEACLSDGYGACTIGDFINLLVRIKDHLFKIGTAFKNLATSLLNFDIKAISINGAQFYFTMAAAMMFFGFLYWKTWYFYQSFSAVQFNTFQGLISSNRSPYMMYFEALENAAYIYELGFQHIDLSLEFEKPGTEKKRKEEIRNSQQEILQKLKETVFGAFGKIFYALTYKIVYQFNFILLKQLGPHTAYLLLLITGIVKILLSLKKLYESILDTKQKINELVGLNNAVKSSEFYFEKLLIIVKQNASFLEYRYYVILYHLFGTLNEEQNQKDFMNVYNSEEIKVKVENSVAEKVRKKEKNNPQNFLKLIDPENIRSKPNPEIAFLKKTQNDVFEKDEKAIFFTDKKNLESKQEAIFIGKIWDLSLKYPRLWISLKNSFFLNKDTEPGNSLIELLNEKIFYLLNYGPISNVIIVEKNNLENNDMKTILEYQGYHFVNLHIKPDDIIYAFCRSCNNDYALANMSIRFARSDNPATILKHYTEIKNFRNQLKSIEIEPDNLIQIDYLGDENRIINEAIKFIKGGFGLGLGDNQNFVYNIFGFFLYTKLENKETNSKSTDYKSLLCTLRPTFSAYEGSSHEKSLTEHKQAVDFQDIRKWTNENKWNSDDKNINLSLSTNVKFKLVYSDCKNEIDYKGQDTKESKTQENYPVFINDFFSLYSSDKNRFICLYVGCQLNDFKENKIYSGFKIEENDLFKEIGSLNLQNGKIQELQKKIEQDFQNPNSIAFNEEFTFSNNILELPTNNSFQNFFTYYKFTIEKSTGADPSNNQNLIEEPKINFNFEKILQIIRKKLCAPFEKENREYFVAAPKNLGLILPDPKLKFDLSEGFKIENNQEQFPIILKILSKRFLSRYGEQRNF